MAEAAPPHFVIRNHFQKGGLYEHLLTPKILEDMCLRTTGRSDFTAQFVHEGCNIGRLAILEYTNKRIYISVSETEIRSRNSSFQSLSSALTRYLLDPCPEKAMCFYVHPATSGNLDTDYFMFMYRLMRTSGVQLLNLSEHTTKDVAPFVNTDDIILQKERLRKKGSGNNSTYITRGPTSAVQIYGKTFGANKYESTLLCVAAAMIPGSDVELYQVREGGLRALPATSIKAIRSLGNVRVFTSDQAFETADFEANDSLRSARFVYNLLKRLGRKKCAFCECEIPQLIQGAHIWPVASIKAESNLPLEEKLRHALDEGNGLWLCENHHKLLDSETLFLTVKGLVKFQSQLGESDRDFVDRITTSKALPVDLLKADFVGYLGKRNAHLEEEAYLAFAV